MWFKRDYTEDQNDRLGNGFGLAVIPITVLLLLLGSACNAPSAGSQPQAEAKEQKNEAAEAAKFKLAIENNEQVKAAMEDINNLKARVAELEPLKDEVEKLKVKAGAITKTIDTDRKVRDLENEIETLNTQIKDIDARIKPLEVKIDAGRATRKDIDDYANLKARRGELSSRKNAKESERSRLTKSPAPAIAAPPKR